MARRKRTPKQKPAAVDHSVQKAAEHRRYHPTEYAADHLGLSSRFLEAMRRTGGGPEFCSFGKAVRYTVEALDAWAATRKRRSTSDHEVA